MMVNVDGRTVSALNRGSETNFHPHSIQLRCFVVHSSTHADRFSGEGLYTL